VRVCVRVWPLQSAYGKSNAQQQQRATDL
jgi:hypothetical protein